MKKIIILFMAMFMLASCVSKPNSAHYEDELSAWVGQRENALYAEWGYPNVRYSVGPDAVIVTYIKLYNEPIDGDAEPYADNMTYSAMRVPSYGLPTSQGVYYCKTSFVIEAGIVTDYNFNGDDCVR